MFYTYYKTWGNKILFRYKNGSARTQTKVVDFYEPYLYTQIQGQDDDEVDAFSIYGNPLKKVPFENNKAARQFVDTYSNVDGMSIHGNTNFANQFIIDMFEGAEPQYDPNQIRVGFLDIEVYSDDGFPFPDEAKHPINGVTFYDSVEDRFYTYSLKHKGEDKWSKSRAQQEVQELDTEFYHFETEKDLLIAMLHHFKDHDYDLTTGWNSEQFDMVYIVNRCYSQVGQKTTNKMLSPFGKISFREVKDDFGKPRTKVDIFGLPHLDYMELYKKHTFEPRASHKLDYIAHVELGEKKLDYEQYGDLFELWKENYQLFNDYNIQDVNLVVRLDKKLGLFDLTYALAYYSMSNYEDTMGTVKVWEQLVAKFLYTKGVAPLARREEVTEYREFEGAYVKQPRPGFYEWIESFDLASLYPHIEMQYNIGPETLIPEDELPPRLAKIKEDHTFDDLLNERIDLSPLDDHGVTMTANFEFYTKDKMSFFSEIKRELYTQRKVFKKKMLEAEQEIVNVETDEQKRFWGDIKSKNNNMQMGLKILLNGGYGALANKHFLYYKVENAEAITLSGQLVNKWTCSHIDQFLQRVLDTDDHTWVYSDTDSGYFTIDAFVKQLPKDKTDAEIVDLCDQFGEEVISPEIEARCQRLADYTRAYEQKMMWERETIAKRAVFVAKKKYVMAVLDNEGTRYKPDQPKIKIMGMESVKGGMPDFSKEALVACYTAALEGDESKVHQIVADTESYFHSLGVNDIALVKNVNNIEKWEHDVNLYKSGTPMHVKAAIIHNMMVDKVEAKRVPKIESGSKIKYVELNVPNPTRQSVIAFDTFMPSEFEIEPYVNYELMFEKAFLQPLQIFLDAVGWHREEVNTLF